MGSRGDSPCNRKDSSTPSVQRVLVDTQDSLVRLQLGFQPCFHCLSPQFLAGLDAEPSRLFVFRAFKWGILRPLWGITRDLISRSPGCVERLLGHQVEERRGVSSPEAKCSTAGMQAGLRLALE